MKSAFPQNTPQLRKVPPPLGFGVPALDLALKGGLARGALHEFYSARAADAVALTGLGLILAAQAAKRGKIIWVRQDHTRLEVGAPSAAGLASLGLNHRRFILVEARDMLSALRASLEGARCGGLSSLVLETWGEHRVFDLTASRRFFLAAQQSGVTLLALRAAANPAPSSAETRWLVKAAPSRPFAANAPGFPRFELSLLRHRAFSAGFSNASWCVEWNSETRNFILASESTAGPPLSRPVVPLPADRKTGAEHQGYRRAS